MTRALIYLRTTPERRDELLKAFERLAVLSVARELPGFLGAELQVPVDADDQVLLSSFWSTPQHFEAWLATEQPQLLLAEVRNLLVAAPETHVYRVVESVS
jgi:heme-degrading monooxygenase HmoA